MNWDDKGAQAEVRDLMRKINLCGCGSGSGDYDIILMLLERAMDHDARGSFYERAEDASERWVEFGAKVLDSWGLLEHGTGIGYAWLTKEGHRMLDFLREFDTDADGWPDWATSEVVS